jgi:hypothetical protein
MARYVAPTMRMVPDIRLPFGVSRRPRARSKLVPSPLRGKKGAFPQKSVISPCVPPGRRFPGKCKKCSLDDRYIQCGIDATEAQMKVKYVTFDSYASPYILCDVLNKEHHLAHKAGHNFEVIAIIQTKRGDFTAFCKISEVF